MPFFKFVSASWVRMFSAWFLPVARTASAVFPRLASAASLVTLSAASSRLSATVSAFASMRLTHLRLQRPVLERRHDLLSGTLRDSALRAINRR